MPAAASTALKPPEQMISTTNINHCSVDNLPSKNLFENRNSYQCVANRVQQWNRRIPEEGYITLGTIRYGVRLSTGSSGFAGSLSSSSRSLSQSNTTPNSPSLLDSTNNKHQQRTKLKSFANSSTNADRCTVNRSESGASSVTSSEYKTCCCVGTSGLSLPCWTANGKRCCKQQNQTNLALSTETAKNRTLSASQLASRTLRTSSQHSTPSITLNTTETAPTLQQATERLDTEIIELNNLLNNPKQLSQVDQNELIKLKTKQIDNMSSHSMMATSSNIIDSVQLPLPQQSSNIELSSETQSLICGTTAREIERNENLCDQHQLQYNSGVCSDNRENITKIESNTITDLCQSSASATSTINSPTLNARNEQLKTYQQHQKQQPQSDQSTKNSVVEKNDGGSGQEKSTEFVSVGSYVSRELFKINYLSECSSKNRSSLVELSESPLNSLAKSIVPTKICCYTKPNIYKCDNSNITNKSSGSSIPRAIINQSLDNYSQNLSKNRVKQRRRLSPPPPVPPKPYRSQIARSKSVDSYNESNYDEDQDQSTYDPLNFRRKLQKFEQKNFLQKTTQPSHLHRFEFFNCFSGSDNCGSATTAAAAVTASLASHGNQVNKNIENRQQLPIIATLQPSPIIFGPVAATQSNWQKQQTQPNQQNGVRRTLRYNSSGRLKDTKDTSTSSIGGGDTNTITCNDTSQLIVPCIEKSTIPAISQSSDSQLKLYLDSVHRTQITPSVVIRKLTPKLTRKSFNFNTNNNNNNNNSKNYSKKTSDNICCDRGDSEDRLIENHNQYNDQSDDSNSISKYQTNNNHNKFNKENYRLDYDNKCSIILNQEDESICGYQHEDDSDIGYIDSSGDNDHLSSVSSDLNINIVGTYSNNNLIRSDSFEPEKSTVQLHDPRNINNTSDSIATNNKQLNKNANESSLLHQTDNNTAVSRTVHQNDIYDSLSDFGTSTISFLSEDNISCGCSINNNNNNNQNIIENLNSTSSCSSPKSTSEFDFIQLNKCNNDSGNNKNLCCCRDRVNRFCKELQSQEQTRKYLAGVESTNIKHQHFRNSSDSDLNQNILPKSPVVSSPPLPLPPIHPNKSFARLTTSNSGEARPLNCTNSIRGTLLKRIPAIDSFGYISRSSSNVTESQDKGIIMEKRRNTLDRLQRLGFGRRSTPSPTQSLPTDKTKKSSEKTERLKELTELLRGNRSSPVPPPVPPPRKPRSQLNSFEKCETTSEPLSPLRAADSDEILAMDEDEVQLSTPARPTLAVNLSPIETSLDGSASAPIAPQKCNLYEALRPNTSVSNLESFILRRNTRDASMSPPPVEVKDISSELPRPESRTVIGSYTQKDILYRSASFSQVDYSSGKYIKSTFNAFRDKFRRDKTNRQPSVIANANLTLPRKKDENRSQSPRREQSAEPDFIYIPLKKSELNISLNNNNNILSANDKNHLDLRVNQPEIIMEEDIQTLDSEKTESRQSQSQTSNKIKEFDDSKEVEQEEVILPTTIEDQSDKNIRSFEYSNPITISQHFDQTSQSNLATLTEEEILMESPPENFLQTATTCLIPVPVYECITREWDSKNSSEQWMDVAPDEIGLTSENVDPIPTVLNAINSESVCNKIDKLPIISVSHDTPHDSMDETPILREEINFSRLSVERSFDDMKSPSSTKCDPQLEFTEVKKRYSNDETKIGDRSQSADSILPRGGCNDEKRRIDKSRRRKGMYIQWPAVEREVGDIINSDWNESTESNSADDKEKDLVVDVSKVNLPDFKSNASTIQSPELIILSLHSPEDRSRTPGSLCSFDPSTPDSDYNGRPPIWPRGGVNRRTSLSCQSSEEKDDVPPAAVSAQRSQRNMLFFKNDSMSDNESDRTPPPSRDRTSPSPAPDDSDLKRYSKRPLRGPYGQMLEAEMKKPGKVQYDEILEELKDTEGFTKLTNRVRSSQSNRSFDNSRTIPQYSSSMRIRKSNAYLPVPTHTRAASTPSQMENITTNTKTSLQSETQQDKHYQRRTSIGTENKKYSPDNCDVSRDRSPKRASSEIPDTKSHPKRSSSTASERHHDKQKRSLEEMRLSQSSRTTSERSMTSDSGKTGTGNILPTPELLAVLLKGSSERQISTERQQMFADTRSHVVHEMYQHEQNYVEALNTVVGKYLHVLKTPEYAGMIDSRTVDEIFYMIPEILAIHEKFLNELQSRLEMWDSQQKVGDAFIDTFSKPEVLETYTCYVNNCNRAEEAIRATKQSRPSFAKFLQTTASKHAGKLSLSNFLIKPVQKFPHYEMLFKRLIKNTDIDHPDQKPLEEVLKLTKEISVHLDCKKKEVNENGQREATLRELETVIEGISELQAPERQYIGFEIVSVVSSGQGARKERGFFLFSDLLVLTSIKRIKKPNTITYPGSVASTLDTNTNKYKFLIKVSLDNIEIIKTKDENLRKKMNEIEDLIADSMKWQQICELVGSLKVPHQWFEEKARDYLCEVQRTLTERQSNDTQLNLLELLINSPSGSQNLSIAFSKAEKRSQWEEAVNEAKQKLAASLERHPIPEFKISIAICKTRAGLQFTCAAPILSNQKDVWVCNSDGYIGQVGILSINPEPPTVKICAGICNARILCVASVPASTEAESKSRQPSIEEIPISCRNSNSSNYNVKTTTDKIDSVGDVLSINVNKSTTKIDNDRRSDMQLDSNSSSDDSEPEGGSSSINSGIMTSELATTVINVGGANLNPTLERASSPVSLSTSAVPNIGTSNTTTSTVQHQHQDSNSDDTDCQQSTMWLGTEDGCIHVYNCNDNIRTKKNKLKIEHKSAVYSILYLDNRVFVSLANGDICVYLRDSGGWNTSTPLCISIGTVSSPVNKLLNVHGKLWCSIQGIIKVIDTKTLQVECQIQISSDAKPITNMVVCNNFVWISIQNSAHIKCFHSNSHELVFEINLAPSVNKMLSNCDDIIRQHKAACLRVTSLLACKDLIWVGTSAGVLLTIPAQGYNKGQINNAPLVTGIPHGHTGHVRFLTCIDSGIDNKSAITSEISNTISTTTCGGTNRNSNVMNSSNTCDDKSKRHSIHSKSNSETGNILIISGGDGYENFGNSGSLSEVAGREDSTNHLLLWQI